MIFKKRELVKIPNFISIFYLKNNFLVFKYGNELQFFRVVSSSMIEFLFFKNKVYLLTNCKNTNLTNYTNNRIKAQQYFYSYKIKLCINGISHKLHKKLSLIGVGYKVFKIKSFLNCDIFIFKLGFSHFIYLKVKTNDINFFCIKNTRIFINGNLLKITYLSGLIKSLKKPEVYKGKGIRFQEEKIILKQIKKK